MLLRDIGRPEVEPNKLLSRALFESFKTWGARDKVYRKLYRKLEKDTFLIVSDSIKEMTLYKPGQYSFWWDNNHMRYQNIKNMQTRLVHELMYHFLTKFARGELKNDYVPAKKSSKRRKEDFSPETRSA